ncbi:hypothetical protein JW964_21565, partial [candidate division KSB1 bacterium]|nr:hypothetical protein [candidate division KSB1 bacterium]
ELSGFKLNPKNYYVVVANFNPAETIMGMFHQNASFYDTRMYGLTSDTLYYLYISEKDSAKSFLSTVLTYKESYFYEHLIDFIGLFPFISQAMTTRLETAKNPVWIDVRKFEIPKKFQKNCDISMIVKKDFYDEKYIARARFDNTSLDRWSYGISTAITSIEDVDFYLENGVIVVRPKPKGDLASFGVINYHFKAVDTKAKSVASSFHVLGGFRISRTIEPILGIGMGVPISQIDLHIFVGYSVEFAQTLDDGYHVGDVINEAVDPFKLKIRGRPRLGIELKFP